MRFRWMTCLLLAPMAGCGWLTDTQKFSIFFQPYSTETDQQALDSIQKAADFARGHPLQPVAVDGYSAPPGPRRDTDGLSAQRAEKVKQVLIANGVRPDRIATIGNGTTDPKPLPDLAARRVDINVGN